MAATLPDHSVHAAYWERTRRLTLRCLALWFLATFLVIFFARELSAFTFFGWPVSFYLAAQGLTLGYTVLIAFYAYAMREHDKILTQGGAHGE